MPRDRAGVNPCVTVAMIGLGTGATLSGNGTSNPTPGHNGAFHGVRDFAANPTTTTRYEIRRSGASIFPKGQAWARLPGRHEMNRSAEGLVPAIEFDITTIAAIWMGGVIVLVPLIGLMARFGLAPVIDAVARMRGGGETGEVEAERFRGLEARVVELARAVERLEAAHADRHAPLA